MSKIGRKPIDITGVQVEIKGNLVHYKGPKGAGVHELPEVLNATIEGSTLTLKAVKSSGINRKSSRDVNRVWGLHRALLYNILVGAAKEFQRNIQINGLGFKAAKSGADLVLTLGYSHKIDFPLPKNVSVDIDKTGQMLVLKSADRELVGQVCSDLRMLRPPEPYKGTGIKYGEETLRRKAGKTKAS